MGAPQQDRDTNTEAKQSASAAKTVYFIRHAESDENRRRFSLAQCLENIATGSMPSTEDINASFELLNVPAQVDSDVSEVGAQQIAHMGQVLQKNNFLDQTGVQLVVHSPLLRARRTCEGLLGCVAGPQKGKLAPTVSRVEQLDILRERTPQEVPQDVILKDLTATGAPIRSNFARRVEQFEKWLNEQPEDVVAVVGHSNHFRSMLNLPFKFNNCEVWVAKFDPTAIEACQGQQEQQPSTWSQVQKVYECEVIRQQPERQHC